jgi:hypothetical protein
MFLNLKLKIQPYVGISFSGAHFVDERSEVRIGPMPLPIGGYATSKLMRVRQARM